MDVSKLGTDRVQQDRVSEQSATQKSQAAKESTESKKAQAAATAGTARKSAVKWSPDAQLLADGVNAAKSSADVRMDRVAAIKEAIRNGSYHADPKKIADKMIQESLANDVATRND